MPDPVESRPFVARLRRAPKSLGNLRDARRQKAAVATDDFGTPWPLPAVPAATARERRPSAQLPSERERPAQPGVPPVPLRRSFDMLRSRPAAPPPAAPAAPPAPPPLLAAPRGAQAWPCGAWLPHLGQGAGQPLSCPRAPWPQGALPPSFDAETAQAAHLLLQVQGQGPALNAFRRCSPSAPAALDRAARYLVLHVLEKREQLRRQHLAAERDAESHAVLRQALLAWVSRLLSAGCNLAGPLREVNQRTLVYYACKWADAEVLNLLLSQPMASIDFSPLRAANGDSLQRFCFALRADVSIRMPELEALAASAGRSEPADIATCFRLLAWSFVCQAPHLCSDTSLAPDACLYRGLYFFAFFAVSSGSVAMLEGLLEAGAALGPDFGTRIATAALHVSLGNSFLAGAHACLAADFGADLQARIAPPSGRCKLDFNLPADLTPLHVLAQLRFRAGGLQEQEALALAEALTNAGAEPRALALVSVQTPSAMLERDTLVSPATLAVLHDNVELAALLAELARRRSRHEKLAELAELEVAAAPSGWRHSMLADLDLQLHQAARAARGQAPAGPGPVTAARQGERLMALFAALNAALEQVFSANLERGFGLHDTGEVRFLRSISRLRLAVADAHARLRDGLVDLDEAASPMLGRIVASLEASIEALAAIDVHRSDVDRRQGTLPSHDARARELFDDGAGNPSVLREDDSFGALRPLPLLATIARPDASLLTRFLRTEPQPPTYDCVAAFGLALLGQHDRTGTLGSRPVPALAKQMMASFDGSRGDWDVVLTGWLMHAIRLQHRSACLAVLQCAERTAGAAHHLPLEAISAFPSLLMHSSPEVLQLVLAFDRKRRWLSAWSSYVSEAGDSLLHMAARRNASHAQQLIAADRAGAKRQLSASDWAGRTPLQVALECGHLEPALACWALRPQLPETLRATQPLLAAATATGTQLDRLFGAVAQGERLRAALTPVLLAAAIWHDDATALGTLLDQLHWSDCLTIERGGNLLHAVARSNAIDCLQAMLNQSFAAFADLPQALRRLARQPDAQGALPEAVCISESTAQFIRARLLRGAPLPPLPPAATPPPPRLAARAQALMGRGGPAAIVPVVPEPVRYSRRPVVPTAASLRQQALRQRQGMLMLCRQAGAQKRADLLRNFAQRPEWLDWAKPSDDDVDTSARDNLAWELLRALDDAEAHKGLGTQFAALAPDTTDAELGRRLQRGASTVGRYAASDALPLVALRCQALALCEGEREGAPVVAAGVDVQMVLAHPALCARVGSLDGPGRSLRLQQTQLMRFVVRRALASRQLEVVEAEPVLAEDWPPARRNAALPLFVAAHS